MWGPWLAGEGGERTESNFPDKTWMWVHVCGKEVEQSDIFLDESSSLEAFFQCFWLLLWGARWKNSCLIPCSYYGKKFEPAAPKFTGFVSLHYQEIFVVAHKFLMGKNPFSSLYHIFKSQVFLPRFSELMPQSRGDHWPVSLKSGLFSMLCIIHFLFPSAVYTFHRGVRWHKLLLIPNCSRKCFSSLLF